MANLIGKDFGRYHLVEKLGEGGMSCVYKAQDKRLERFVALKVITASDQNLGTFLKRFEREAKALAKLSHTHIVPIHDYGEYDNIPYLVMEYISGGTLKKYLGNPMSYTKVAQLMAPVARALEYAHKQQIIHRDIKPANILINSSDQAMLSDFGIAKILGGEESTQLTGAGIGIGTPDYMSPEQGQGLEVDQRSDIYSFGVVLYELISGHKPFTGNTPMAVMIRHISDPLPDIHQYISNLPDDVCSALYKSMAKLPKDRYQNMGELAAILEKMTVKTDNSVNLEQSTIFASRPESQIATERQPRPSTTAETELANSDYPLPASLYSRSSDENLIQPLPAEAPPSYTNQPADSSVKPSTAKIPVWIIIAAVVGIGAVLCILMAVGGGLFLKSGDATPTHIAQVVVVETPQPTNTEAIQPDRTATSSKPKPPSKSPNIASKAEALKANTNKDAAIGDLAKETYTDAQQNTVGKRLTYTVDLDKSRALLLYQGWCATKTEILIDNLKNIQLKMAVDGKEVASDRIGESYYKDTKSNMQCFNQFILLDVWPQGQHQLITKITFKKPLNDGKLDFSTGDLTSVYNVTVK